jgi:hypothetical protein
MQECCSPGPEAGQLCPAEGSTQAHRLWLLPQARPGPIAFTAPHSLSMILSLFFTWTSRKQLEDCSTKKIVVKNVFFKKHDFNAHAFEKLSVYCVLLKSVW